MSIELQPEINQLGQLVGYAVPHWTPPPIPERTMLSGRLCHLEPLDPSRHAAALYEANSVDQDGSMWTYLPYGPFETSTQYRAWMESVYTHKDPIFYAIVDNSTNRPAGVASYMRITPQGGTIEVGHLAYAPALQHTAAATEAMYLLMDYAFTLGYRRYEWKCDTLNAPSRAAAQRLGFSFEGIFLQDRVIKGRNRDTAWYSIIDREWPALQAAFLRWLDPNNFDAEGRQRVRLSEITRPLLRQEDLHS